MLKGEAELQEENEREYLERRAKLDQSLPEIKYDQAANKDFMIKYNGYMHLQKRKAGSGEPTKYMESVFISDACRSKNMQFDADIVSRFTKTHKISGH